ncbi:S49 family peptidase [Roseicitreum antarcticum]|uniref:S49 family peptidase n=1 Tax=Roseicitreum antarcticum TaxID=564137 RepID=UPI00295ACBBE|nr:S49 family peptidase [Roseicitreum antarcticum]
MHAFVAEHALSAGYVLASQADRIILPRTGAVGSIGVVALHTDMSGALDQKGIAVTLIHAGAHKIDANPYQPLPKAVHDQMQRELEVVRFLFAETVAAGRGDRLTHAAALATEAAVFRGADAIAAGLADDLADPVTAFHAFAAAPAAPLPPAERVHR